mmetsp:Transcript_31501/g.49320  ORF Transcript_31501/g.49320 Transcript_31501/m.49320 type:complete len:180 (+) Transcript_31501:999-1538(+)
MQKAQKQMQPSERAPVQSSVPHAPGSAPYNQHLSGSQAFHHSGLGTGYQTPPVAAAQPPRSTGTSGDPGYMMNGNGHQPQAVVSPKAKVQRSLQRDAASGDPVCAIPQCGKYGQYTFADTGHNVCSVECKRLIVQHIAQQKGIQLPQGWEQRQTSSGKTFYVDHNTCTTHWSLPGRPGR